MPRMLGCKKSDPRKIRRAASMEHYLVAANLPRLPQATNWRSRLNAATLGAMLNDQWGCCVVSAQGHSIQAYTACASQEVTVPDSSILNGYIAMTGEEGAAFNPGPPAVNDNGVQLSDGIDYMINTGIDGHMFLAKLSINPRNFTSIQYGLALFGIVQIGVSLTPQTLQSTDTWDIPAHIPFFHRHEYTPNPSLGHAIAVVDYNADGSLVVISWGQFFTVTPAWQAACIDEAWVPLSPDWANTAGMAPNMLDWETLKADYPSIALA